MILTQTSVNQLILYLMKTLGIKITLILFTLTLQAQDTITGSWEGTLNVQGTELPLLFHITEEDGNYKSTMDSPAQGATGILMSETTYKEEKLIITYTQAGIRYVAKLEEGKITGTFYQSGLELPLIMKPKTQ